MFHIPPHLIVQANVQDVRHVLLNLFSNACKYSPPGQPILIEAALHDYSVQRERPVPQIRITIRDFGVGTTPHAPQLFKRGGFLQNEAAQWVHGAGLGLYVSRLLVENLGGSIWLESEAITGEGTRACFTLPCVPHAKATARKTTRSLLISSTQSMFDESVTHTTDALVFEQ
jgi:signal transduction histidine kinase